MQPEKDVGTDGLVKSESGAGSGAGQLRCPRALDSVAKRLRRTIPSDR